MHMMLQKTLIFLKDEKAFFWTMPLFPKLKA